MKKYITPKDYEEAAKNNQSAENTDTENTDDKKTNDDIVDAEYEEK